HELLIPIAASSEVSARLPLPFVRFLKNPWLQTEIPFLSSSHKSAGSQEQTWQAFQFRIFRLAVAPWIRDQSRVYGSIRFSRGRRDPADPCFRRHREPIWCGPVHLTRMAQLRELCVP